MDYGPHIIFVLNCVVLLTLGGATVLNKAASPQSKQSTKKCAQGHQKWWNQTDARLQSKCRKFQTLWKIGYFFIETKGKCVCLICNDSVAVMKEYNVRRHYEMKHQTFTSYTGAEQEEKVKQMTASLWMQQQFFFPCWDHTVCGSVFSGCRRSGGESVIRTDWNAVWWFCEESTSASLPT